MAEGRSMEALEREIATLFERRFSARGWAEVRLTVHDAGGAQSFEGSRLDADGVERPLRDAETWDIVGFDEAASRQLSDLLFDLHEASQAASLGPWYCAEIRVAKGAGLTTVYHWEGTPVRSVAELKVHGLSVPLHPFKGGLSASLLRDWPERLLADAIDTFVIAQSQRGGAVAMPVLEVFALYDWIGDTNNGGHNQYFARRQDQVGAGIDRTILYPHALAMLTRLGVDEWQDLYEEAIALFAHFHPGLEAVRQQLGIEAVPRQEQADLDDRFFEVSGAMQERLCEYIRANVDSLATDATSQS